MTGNLQIKKGIIMPFSISQTKKDGSIRNGSQVGCQQKTTSVAQKISCEK